MSNLDDILWSLRRQARSFQEVLADARLVWRDANARAAEQRFLQPLAESEGALIKAAVAQQQALNSAAADVGRAQEQQRIAAVESSQVDQQNQQASRNVQAALAEASTATDLAQQADGLAGQARSFIQQAAAAGGS